MSAPSLPLKEKVFIYLKSLLLVATVFSVVSLYVPAKQLWAGTPMTFGQVITHMELKKKLPFILIISLLMTRSTIIKRKAQVEESEAK